MLRPFLSVCFCFLLILLPGCGEPDDLPAAHYFTIAVGGTPVRMQLALSQEEITRGLMFREELPDDAGMIFVFPEPGRRSFYMRNTFIPLDVGYFTSDGVLREIYPMYPRDETGVPSRSENIQFALEMNQGWFRENAIRPGATLDLQALRRAIADRGYAPANYGLYPEPR